MKAIVFAFLLLPLMVPAQQSPSYTGWRTSVAAGGAYGEHKPGALLQVQTGYQRRNFYIGAGAAFDGYVDYSYPVFLSLRWNAAGIQWLYAYANGGVSLPADRKDGQRNQVYTYYTQRYGRLYTDAGAGLQLLNTKSHSLFLTLGYSTKQSREEKTFTTPCRNQPCDGFDRLVTTSDLKMARIVARIVFEFNW